MAELHPDIEEILLDEQDIKDIVKKVGAEITRDYADKNPWSLLFFAELLYSWPTSCAPLSAHSPSILWLFPATATVLRAPASCAL